MITQEKINSFEELLKGKGFDGLYSYLIGAGILLATEIKNPEIEFLNMADKFFALSRRTGKEEYFTIGKVLRKAAHKLYRKFLRTNKNKEKNLRFLNVVK